MGTLELNIRNAGWRLDSLESERLWVQMLRGDWRRPEDPVLIDAHQVQALCLEEHVEKRVNVSLRILGALVGVWLYLHEIGAPAGA